MRSLPLAAKKISIAEMINVKNGSPILETSGSNSCIVTQRVITSAIDSAIEMIIRVERMAMHAFFSGKTLFHFCSCLLLWFFNADNLFQKSFRSFSEQSETQV